MNFDTKNPYRYLFPIACLNGILGSIQWIAFATGQIEFYPAQIHSNMMIGGFILLYALGFLWTAIPRFLQSPNPSQKQMQFIFGFSLLSPMFGLLKNPAPFYLLWLLLIFTTIQFGFSCLKNRQNNPFPSFLFVFFGFFIAAISIFTLLIGSYVELPQIAYAIARTFFHKGFVLFLYMGIGSKLIPILTGWEPLPGKNLGIFLNPFFILIILVLTVGLIAESAGDITLAALLYGLTLSFVGIRHMKLNSIPREKSALSLSIWVSSWLISLSPFLLIFFPSYSSHFWHLIFISGFGLLTLFVSLRVTLAHSGQNFSQWERKFIFYCLCALVLLATVTRVSAPFIPKVILSHYAYAASLWILAQGIWLFYFIKFTYWQPVAQDERALEQR